MDKYNYISILQLYFCIYKRWLRTFILVLIVLYTHKYLSSYTTIENL